MRLKALPAPKLPRSGPFVPEPPAPTSPRQPWQPRQPPVQPTPAPAPAPAPPPDKPYGYSPIDVTGGTAAPPPPVDGSGGRRIPRIPVFPRVPTQPMPKPGAPLPLPRPPGPIETAGGGEAPLQNWVSENRGREGAPQQAAGFGTFINPAGSAMADVYGSSFAGSSRAGAAGASPGGMGALMGSAQGKQGLLNQGGLVGPAADTIHGLDGFQV